MGESELIDRVDKSDKVIGQVVRSDAHQKGWWHRSAHIWVYSPSGKVLIQRRSKDKRDSPNLLDISAAGHLKSGESAVEGAHSEILEEIGIDVPIEKLEVSNIFFDERPSAQMPELHRQVLYMFFIELPENTEFTCDDGEVEELVWMDYKTFSSILTDSRLRDMFVNHEDYYMDYVIKEIGTRIA